MHRALRKVKSRIIEYPFASSQENSPNNSKHDLLDDADLVGDLEGVEVLGETYVSLLLAVGSA